MKGKLSVIGLGPGFEDYIIPAARKSLDAADIIVGYHKYLKLIENLISEKEKLGTGMRKEIERVKIALDQAAKGKKVCLVSSGDAGVYGMAGLALELLSQHESTNIDLDIVPGITAASSCAALLGAPLMHDFAVISLSNLLTDSDLIKKRLVLAAEGDFVTVLYNPKSSKRTVLLEEARNIFLEKRAENTPVGIVKNGYRESSSVAISTIKELPGMYDQIDMTTTLIIGNSHTFNWGEYMVTPRGYDLSSSTSTNKQL